MSKSTTGSSGGGISFVSLQGPPGADGAVGPTGPAGGPAGPTGPAGADGSSATIAVNSTSSLAPGSPATVVNVGSALNGLFNFGIPKGSAATVAAGTTTTLTAGSPATVVNSGDTENAVFDFSIPQGIQGVSPVYTVSYDPARPSDYSDINVAINDGNIPNYSTIVMIGPAAGIIVPATINITRPLHIVASGQLQLDPAVPGNTIDSGLFRISSYNVSVTAEILYCSNVNLGHSAFIGYLGQNCTLNAKIIANFNIGYDLRFVVAAPEPIELLAVGFANNTIRTSTITSCNWGIYGIGMGVDAVAQGNFFYITQIISSNLGGIALGPNAGNVLQDFFDYTHNGSTFYCGIDNAHTISAIDFVHSPDTDSVICSLYINRGKIGTAGLSFVPAAQDLGSCGMVGYSMSMVNDNITELVAPFASTSSGTTVAAGAGVIVPAFRPTVYIHGNLRIDNTTTSDVNTIQIWRVSNVFPYPTGGTDPAVNSAVKVYQVATKANADGKPLNVDFVDRGMADGDYKYYLAFFRTGSGTLFLNAASDINNHQLYFTSI